ncbi:DUF2514 family protein [Hydrogenophaga sp. ANAO-22]|uniref:DUF2514 family protein n=1 Tax=Hydrogenophaga sp. ANAO-22 TaxID=3166645 RepID=UPI0036D38E2F
MITKAAIACVLVVGAAAALQTYRLRGAEMALLEHQNSSLRARARAVDVAIEEGNRRTAAVQKEVEDARKKIDALEGAAADAAAAGRSLRDEFAAARARACRTDSTAPGGSQAAEATERMLADVQRRLDEAQERVARYADQARIAGLACEGAYRALTP